MLNYTVLLFTYNEERRIELLLRNFKDHARIVVLDDSSTDKTAEIAAKYSATVIQRPKFNAGYNNKDIARWALDQSSTEYVFIAYCSHFVPINLLNIFDDIAANQNYKAVRHGYLGVTYGKYIDKQCVVRKPGACHFFSREVVDLSASKIHYEWPLNVPDTQILTLPVNDDLSLHVFRDYDAHITELKQSAYADAEAKERFERGERTTAVKMIRRALLHFICGYFRDGGIRAGVPGLLYHMWWAQMVFNIQARIWEYQHNKRLDEVRLLNFHMRDDLLEKIENELLNITKKSG